MIVCSSPSSRAKIVQRTTSSHCSSPERTKDKRASQKFANEIRELAKQVKGPAKRKWAEDMLALFKDKETITLRGKESLDPAVDALRKLADDSTWRTGIGSAGSPLSLYEGSVYVTANDAAFFGKSVVRLFSVSTVSTSGFGTRTDTSIAYVLKPIVNSSTIRAAITTNKSTTAAPTNAGGRRRARRQVRRDRAGAPAPRR